jgi:predicted kinase
MKTRGAPETGAPVLILITGIMAAGKSTIAQLVAERIPKSVHLRGDVFRKMIVRGRAEMGLVLSEEALAQLRLRYRAAAAVAGLYLDGGFSVVYQDIVIGGGLTEVLRLHAGRPVHVVVLCPSSEAVAGREQARSKKGYGSPLAVAGFDRILRTETPRLGLWVDSSKLTEGETVDFIMANLGRALVNGA